MKGDYPRFRASYTHDELVEHFLLTPAERALVDTCYGEVNRHSVAVLLKAARYLGYFPDHLQQVPSGVRTFIAHQLQLLWDHTEHYAWHSRSRDRHLALIRQYLGIRFPTGQDKAELEVWLRTEAARDAPTDADLHECAYAQLRSLGIELPAERELSRLVRAALQSFFHDLYERVAARLPGVVRANLDQLVEVAPDASQSEFDQLKAGPSGPGVNNLHKEIAKLQALRAIGISEEALAKVPFKVLQTLKQRAQNEHASKMREHPAPIRYALMACFIRLRMMEVTDDAVRMMMEVIQRIDTQTEKQLHKELLQDIKEVSGEIIANVVYDGLGGGLLDSNAIFELHPAHDRRHLLGTV